MRITNVLMGAGAVVAAAGMVAAHGSVPTDHHQRVDDILLTAGGTAVLVGAALTARRGWRYAFDAKVGARALTAHEIRRADVASFVAASKVRQVHFHAGLDEEIARLHSSGTGDLATRGAASVYGSGFYTSKVRPERSYGPATAAVVIDSSSPLVVRGPDDFGKRVEELAGRNGRPAPNSGAEKRAALIDAGYDAVIRNRGGRNWAVAIDRPEQVRVIVADADPDRMADAAGAVRRGLARTLSWTWERL